jgi:hypothetical protein
VTQVNDSNDVDTQAPDSSTTSGPRSGFRAHLQSVGLHDLVMLQNLVRASGTFVVLSGDRTGTLCFSRGQLVHAEVLDLVGEAAALEILSWRDGEFINVDRATPERHTLSASLESLLLRLARDADEVRVSEPPLTTTTGVRRRRTPDAAAARATHQALGLPSTPPRGLAAAATPGTAAPAPKAPLRAGEPRNGVTNVLLSPPGALIDGNGPEREALGARAAYMIRLAELAGQAMGAGEARAIQVRHPSTVLWLRRDADGHVSASYGAADAVLDGAPAPPPSVRYP